MYRLMADYFDNIKRELFERDLVEKHWAVVLFDREDRVQGFTTILAMQIEDEGQKLLGFYSGDTVLAPKFWGEHRWLSVWSRHVFSMAEQQPDARAFWILLTATHRTYQFLPAFFLEYHPRPDRSSPSNWKRWLDRFVQQKFPDEYDADRGVVRLRDQTPVRDPARAAANIPPSDPHAQFFLQRNPGYLQSDFLACITEINRANTTRLGRRILDDQP